METLKTPSEYSVDFNRGFQEVSMANLEKGPVQNFFFIKMVQPKKFFLKIKRNEGEIFLLLFCRAP